MVTWQRTHAIKRYMLNENASSARASKERKMQKIKRSGKKVGKGCVSKKMGKHLMGGYKNRKPCGKGGNTVQHLQREIYWTKSAMLMPALFRARCVERDH